MDGVDDQVEDDPEERRDAVVTPEPIRITARVNPVGILIRSHLWPTWAEIAIEEEANARAARAEQLAIVAVKPSKEGLSEALMKELKAALVCIAAVSHSLDALFDVLAGMVVGEELRRTWKEKGTRRFGQVFETLKRSVDVDPSTREHWQAEGGVAVQ